MLNYFVELVGTFIFLSVIIITGDPLAIGLTLAGVAWFGSKVSGAHYNPAVNVLMLLNNKTAIVTTVSKNSLITCICLPE
mgnify:CR=1 FL=1